MHPQSISRMMPFLLLALFAILIAPLLPGGHAQAQQALTATPTATSTPLAFPTATPTATPAPPAVPGNFAGKVTANGIALSWSAPAGGANGYDIHRLWPYHSTYGPNLLYLVPGSSTSYTDSDVVVAGNYKYRIRAFRGDLPGGWSTLTVVVPASAIPPATGTPVPSTATPTGTPAPTATLTATPTNYPPGFPTPTPTATPAPTASPTSTPPGLPTATPASAPSCANSTAVPAPASNGLVADCETLLALKDQLLGDTTRNWSVNTGIFFWSGVGVSNGRVTHLTLSSGMNGTLPSSLGNLTELKVLSLGRNQLTGTIPSSLGRLTKLEVLSLHHNRLTGSIPSSLGRLTNLEKLLLNHNRLTGTIPSSLDNLVRPGGPLVVVHLAIGNDLCGPIPPKLHAFEHSDVKRAVYPSGTLGDCSSLPAPTTTPTPTPTNTLPGFPTATPTATSTLTFSCANSAAIPDPEAAGLVADCETLLGLKEELAGSAALNWRVDRLIDNWEGISVESERVAALSLANSGLTGGVPSSLGSLAALAVLDLSSNGLTGSIPSSLGNLTALQILILEKNQLTGSIPSSLGSLTALQKLLLHDNQLTGSIPSSLDSLVPPSGSLSAVWLATDNALCGPIPPQLHAFVPSNPSSNNDVSSVSYPSGTLGECSSPSTPTPTATAESGQAVAGADESRSATSAATLTAQAGASAVELRWNAVSGAVRYELMVWWDPLPVWQPIGGADLTRTSYRHTGLTPGTRYFYTIRTVNAAGRKSEWLGEKTKEYPSVTVSQGVPAGGGTSTVTPTPTATAARLSTPALTATATEGGVALRWGTVPGAVRYELKVWWDPLADWQPIAAVTDTSYTHSGLTAGRKYFYTIRAVNAAGETSEWLGRKTNEYPSVTVAQPR